MKDFLSASNIRGHIALVVIAGIITYSNTFQVPFVFDDFHSIVDNPLIKRLEFFLNPSQGIWSIEYNRFITRYLGHLTFALNYKLHGLNVSGYHLVNLVIHIVNALLVYSLAILSFQTPALRLSSLKEYSKHIALFAALFFVTHPVQTQAVTYIVQRFASLATLFYLFSLLMYIKWRLMRGRLTARAADQQEKETNNTIALLFYCTGLFSAVSSMLTKEIAFTLPFMIVLYELMFFEGKTSKRIVYLIPILLTLGIIPTLYLLTPPTPGGGEVVSQVMDGGLLNVSRSQFHLTQISVITTYIRLLFLPVNQSVSYGYPIYSSFLNPVVFSSALFLLLIVCLGVYLAYTSRAGLNTRFRAEKRLIAFGIFWFFIAFMVESLYIPRWPIFEHRIYMSSVGFFLAVTTGIFSFLKKISGEERPYAVNIIIPALFLIVLLLMGAGLARNAVWKDAESLWKDAAGKNKVKALPHIGLGDAYKNKGRFNEAEKEYLVAVQLQPENFELYFHLGSFYMEQKRYEEAVENFRIAIAIDSYFTEGHLGLGRAYEALGRNDETVQEYMTALRNDPNHFEAQSLLILFYSKQGKPDEAVAAYKNNTERTYDHASFHNSISLAYFRAGRVAEATRALMTALAIDPASVETYHNLARIYMKQSRYEDAVRELRATLKLDPNFIDARTDLVAIYLETGRFDEAMKENQVILKLYPENIEARYNMGTMYAQQGHTDAAIREYQAVLNLLPGHIEARNNLAGIYAQMGRYDEAVKELQTILNLKPDFADARFNLDIILDEIRQRNARKP